MNYKYRTILFYIILLLVGTAGGWLWGHSANQTPLSQLGSLRLRSSDYKFIHPLLAVGNNELLHSFDDLQADIVKAVRNSDVSVYLRDLESSRWMSINGEKKYSPASMYKVALMMSILKKAESDPAIFKRPVLFPGFSYDKEPGEREPQPRLVVGKSYSIPELLQYLIIYSDNDAKNTLHTVLTANEERSIFTDLGLKPPSNNDTGDTMSVVDYSIFFRVLYNSTYLRSELSEAALDLLSRADFKNGLVAGVPSNIVVAHKFGRRLFDNNQTSRSEELHDCGIIYYPSHPYFLCVMTRGASDETLSPIIAQISKTTYDYFNREY